jgi:hypothetical protein
MRCACPGRVVDQDRHDAWHALVTEQTGITGAFSSDDLKAARGVGGDTLPGETILDVRARESGRRASGELRRACR